MGLEDLEETPGSQVWAAFPRFTGDGFRIHADWHARERGELDESAAAVRAGLSAFAARRD